MPERRTPLYDIHARRAQMVKGGGDFICGHAGLLDYVGRRDGAKVVADPLFEPKMARLKS